MISNARPPLIYSPRDQQILMYKAQEYQDQVIAEFLGIPMGTVAVSYHRIKKLLRELLLMLLIFILCERKFPWMTS